MVSRAWSSARARREAFQLGTALGTALGTTSSPRGEQGSMEDTGRCAVSLHCINAGRQGHSWARLMEHSEHLQDELCAGCDVIHRAPRLHRSHSHALLPHQADIVTHCY